MEVGIDEGNALPK